MRTRHELERAALGLGVRSDVLEKVERLLAILARVDGHEALADSYALKGGTALNLFHLPLPRLSVDIDINFVGAVGKEDLGPARQRFERALVQCCQRSGCALLRSPGEHAGGKIRLRFPSVFGGTQNLEFDVSYVARVPLFGLVRRRVPLPALGEVEAMTYGLEELAAGKFAALVTRTVARDYFDAASLLALDPDLVRRPPFRVAFVCQAAASRRDCRALEPRLPELPPLDVRQKLIPLLRVEAGLAPLDAGGLGARLASTLQPAVAELVRWSDSERRFLDRLIDGGEIEPELLTEDSEMQARIRQQPMLRWKQLNVQRHRGMDGLVRDARHARANRGSYLTSAAGA